jgi:hypothetical protein
MLRFLFTLPFLITAATLCIAEDTKDTPRDFEVTFSVPNPGWKASITEARTDGKELWVKVVVSNPGGISPQVITKLTPKANFAAADLPVKYIVFGKGWKWVNKEKDVVFLADLDDKKRKALEEAYAEAKVVYEAKK